MKAVLDRMHRPARRTLLIGAAIIAVILSASCVLYIGAGHIFDYYAAVEASELLLASVRPLSVAVSVGSIGLEYASKRREDSAD